MEHTPCSMLPFFIAAAIEPESLSSPQGSAKRFAARETNRPLSLPRQGVNVRRKRPLTNGRNRTLRANGGTPEQLAAIPRKDYDRSDKLLQDLKIRMD